jgi:arylsulfatase A-like enzyme
VQGATDIRTPNIDSIAKNGIRFTNGYVNCPICGPTRAALMTGRYQNRFGFEANPGPKPDPNFGLPEGEKTIANYMKDAGYATGAIGKWHLGYREGTRPHNRGFDSFFGFLGGAHSYVKAGDNVRLNEIRRNDTPVSISKYLTYEFTDEAVSFIDKNHNKPFFLYLAYNAIHSPMDGAKDLEARFAHIQDPKRRTMATMLGAMDDGVGKVLEKLRERGLEENTLVVFLGDNGGPTRDNGSRNDPLSGTKGGTLEGGIRVPFVAQWKGRLPKGTTYDKPIIAMDLLPTVLAAAGAGAPDGRVEGVNLLPHLEGKASGDPHKNLFWRIQNQWAVRQGDWKLVKYRQDPPKLINLAQDIKEEKDLSASNPDKLKELQAAYDEWDSKNVEPKWRDSRDPAQKPNDGATMDASTAGTAKSEAPEAAPRKPRRRARNQQ